MSPVIYAQIVADPSAPSNQRPTVLTTGSSNNIPLVNIQTPSAAGVSRNTYSQFDVTGAGAVLNNSRTNVQTQLGGWVQGNPWLATGSARVILNEVNSSNPSQLRGAIEVAGQRAEVIVANPAGIQVDGASFINTSRATLTTGTPNFTNGNLDGYRVERGTVNIGGAGLDARSTDSTAILARAIEVNAGIWANQLTVTAGTNQIAADTGATTAIPGTGTTPAFALDVAAIGGMYAGKITLVGTEAGLGVRNAGIVQANAGDLVLNANGWLSTTGSLTASQNLDVQTSGAISNSGTLYASGSTGLNAGGNISNTGLIAALGDTSVSSGAAITSASGSVIAAGLASNNSVGSSGNLTVNANTNADLNGQSIAGADIHIAGSALNVAGGQLSGQNLSLLARTGDVNATAATVVASQTLSVSTAHTLRSDGAVLSANQLALTAQDLSNVGGQLLQVGTGDLALNLPGSLDNSAGTIGTNGALALSAHSLNNPGGTLQTMGSAGLNITTAAGLNNRAGQLRAGGALALQADTLDNTQGTATAGDSLTASAAGALTNTDGLLAANQALRLTAASLDNTRGTIASVYSDLGTTTSADMVNDAGHIQAALDVALDTAAFSNRSGSITGRSIAMDTHSQRLDNTLGTVAARQSATLHTGALNNDGGLLQAGTALAIDTHGQTLANSAGSISAGAAITARTGQANNLAGGQILGLASVAFTSTGFDNSAGPSGSRGGQVQALGDVAIDVGTGTLDNTASLLRSGATLSLQAGTVVNSNTNGADQGLEGNNVAITAHAVANDFGAIRANHNATLTSSASIDNTRGLISAGNTLSLQDPARSANAATSPKTLSLTNTDGTLIATRSLAVDAARLTGDGKVLSLGDLSMALTSDLHNTGEITANGNARISTPGDILNHGKLQAGNLLNLSAQNITNAATGEITGQTTEINARNTLTNRGVIDGVDTQVNASTVDNIGTGRIYGDHLSIAAGTVNNDAETVNGVSTAGTIAARDRLDMGVGTLNNREHALVFSGGDMAIGGGLDGNRRATGAANSVNNASATMEALGNMDINAQQIHNTNEHFSTRTVPLGNTTTALYIQPQGTSTKLLASNFVWENWSRAGQYRYRTAPAPNTSGVLGQSPVPRVGEQNCTGPESAEVCTRLQGADYPQADPAWAYLGVTPPVQAPSQPTLASPTAPNPTRAASCEVGNGYSASACAAYTADMASYSSAQTTWNAAWASYTTAHTAWQADTDARYTALDTQIELYNNGFASATIRSWTQYDVTHSETHSEIATSDPGRILSGAAMQLRGNDLVNDKSRIVAGGLLSGDLARLRNIEAEGQHTVHEEGTSQYTYSHWRGGFKRYHQRNWDGVATYAPADTVTTIVLPVTAQLDHTATTGSGLSVALYTAASTAQSTSAAGNPTTALQPVPAPATTQVPTDGGGSVHSATPNTRLPSASLFHTVPAATSPTLVETDPRFTNYRQWLSSDALLTALGYDPVTTQKRLGDGFYEQQLIREQVTELTGHRFLTGYASDEAQYQALIASGVTYAKAWNLRPGIALSAAQMAQLTTDMVWLVEQSVTLADGTTQQVLVPQLYAMVRDGDLGNTGALLSGGAVNLNLTGDLTNSGTIAGRTAVNLTADNIRNLGGRITGNAVAAHARTDLDNIGGQIRASNSLIATAGRDIRVETTTRSASTTAGASSFGRTHLDRVASLVVANPGGILVASAGRDLHLVAASITNAGTDSSTAAGKTELRAERNLNLATASTAEANHIVWDAHNQLHYGSSAEVGTSIQGAGNVRLAAGNDLSARAASVQAGGALTATATHNITLTTGTATETLDEAHQQRSKGFLSSKTTTTRTTQASSTAQASSLGGNTVDVLAHNDLSVQGSNIVSDTGTTLQADRNIAITAATHTASQSDFREEKKSGLMGSGGIGITLGKAQQSTDGQGQSTTAAGSTVAALSGGVAITAGQQYTQVGSQVLATGADGNTAAANVAIQAQNIAITEARETGTSSTVTKQSSSGLTVALSNPVVSAVQGAAGTAHSMASAAKATGGDARMQALAAASVALNGYNAANDLTTLGKDLSKVDPTSATSVGISVSIGSNKSQSTSTAQSDTAAGSTVKALGSVNIIATGAGKDSNLRIQGSDISAGPSSSSVTLQADNAVQLLAAQNTSTQHSQNTSKGGSLGVSFGGGSQSGFSIQASANKAKGQGDGTETTYTNTAVSAGKAVNITSGGDTTLQGATVAANTVTANVGGNLTITSLQDQASYASKQNSSGVGVSLCLPPLCYGASSASASLGKSKIDSNYQSVTKQSGIKAGDGGFQVNAKGDTTLTGGAITSSQAAIDQGQNSFQTGGKLTTTDLRNSASYQANAIQASASVSGLAGAQGTSKADTDAMQANGATDKDIAATAGASTKPTGSAGLGHSSGSADSTTTAGISGIAGDQTLRTGDKPTGIQAIFDKDKVQKTVDAQVAITAAFGSAAAKAVGDYASSQMQQAAAFKAQAEKESDPAKRTALEQQAQSIEAQWGDNGTSRIAAHTLIGGLTGGVGGAVGAAAGTLTAPAVASALQGAGIDGALAQAITTAASTAVGAAAGGTAGAAAAGNEVVNNYLKHDERVLLNKSQKACYADPSSAACGTATALKQKDQLSDKLLANATATCTGKECNDVSNFIAQQMAVLGCTAPSACPDYNTLDNYLRVSQQKAQGLEAVYPESWILDAKAVYDLGKFGVRVLSGASTGAKGSLDALTQLGKTDATLAEANFAVKPSGLNETTPIKDLFGKGANTSTLEEHLATGGPSSKNVYGAHSEAAYKAELGSINGVEVAPPQTIAPGIVEYTYNTPARIAKGQEPLTKTVYDSTYTDAQILDMSKQASSQVWSNIQKTGVVPKGRSVSVEVNGVPFMVNISKDPKTGVVTSFYSHPGKN